jgi:hypothetical protein
VAADWTTIALGALGVAGAIGGGFVGAWMQDRTQRHLELERDRTAKSMSSPRHTSCISTSDRPDSTGLPLRGWTGLRRSLGMSGW